MPTEEVRIHVNDAVSYVAEYALVYNKVLESVDVYRQTLPPVEENLIMFEDYLLTVNLQSVIYLVQPLGKYVKAIFDKNLGVTKPPVQPPVKATTLPNPRRNANV